LKRLLRRFGLTPVAETFGGFSRPPSGAACWVHAGRSRRHPVDLLRSDFSAKSPSLDGERVRSLLLNLTNDAWYGFTPGPYQHLRQAQLQCRGNTSAAGPGGQQRYFRSSPMQPGAWLASLPLGDVGRVRHRTCLSGAASAWDLRELAPFNFGLIIVIMVLTSFGCAQ
jgi:apolipoprotein N-acyltransferase